MIKLMFEVRGQYFVITISNKKILYWDKEEGKRWGGPLQYLPPDPTANMKIDMSRNRIPALYKELLKITPEELKQFNAAKDDNELKDIVIKECKDKQCRLIDTKIE